MKKYLYPLLIFLALGCKGDAELAMERGIQYYEWEMIEKAVLEFKFVVHNLSSQNEKLDYSQIRLKSRAHHNLAVAYAKKEWYDDAVLEAREAFELFPSDDNRKVMELIQNKIPTEPQKPVKQKPTTPKYPLRHLRGWCFLLTRYFQTTQV